MSEKAKTKAEAMKAFKKQQADCNKTMKEKKLVASDKKFIHIEARFWKDKDGDERAQTVEAVLSAGQADVVKIVSELLRKVGISSADEYKAALTATKFMDLMQGKVRVGEGCSPLDILKEVL